MPVCDGEDSLEHVKICGHQQRTYDEVLCSDFVNMYYIYLSHPLDIGLLGFIFHFYLCQLGSTVMI